MTPCEFVEAESGWTQRPVSTLVSDRQRPLIGCDWSWASCSQSFPPPYTTTLVFLWLVAIKCSFSVCEGFILHGHQVTVQRHCLCLLCGTGSLLQNDDKEVHVTISTVIGECSWDRTFSKLVQLHRSYFASAVSQQSLLT